jgi:hypothetical protein
MKRELRGIEWFVETEAFGWIPVMSRDIPKTRWTLFCSGVGKCGMLPELVSRDVDCNDINVLIAALRVTARELNEWKPIDVYMVLEECFWSNTGQQLTFRFADAESWLELPMMGTIMDVTDDEMNQLKGGA